MPVPARSLADWLSSDLRCDLKCIENSSPANVLPQAVDKKTKQVVALKKIFDAFQARALRASCLRSPGLSCNPLTGITQLPP